MNNVRPPVSGSIAVVGADGGLLRHDPRRRRHLGQPIDGLKLDGSIVNPGPWRINVVSAFQPSDGGGGVLWYDIGYYPPGTDTAALHNCVTSPTGVNNTFPSAGGGNWFQPAIGGSAAVGAADYAGGTSYFWGGATAFSQGPGYWVGPGGIDDWWTGLPTNVSNDGGEFRGATPDGLDTASPGYGSRWPPGLDPSVDFDNPVVCVMFRSASAVLVEGLWPTPLEPPHPAKPFDAFGRLRSTGEVETGGALVRLYNNISSLTYLATPWSFPSNAIYSAGPVSNNVVGGVIVDWDGMSFSNLAAFCSVDLSQPPLAMTSLVAGATDSGLLVVG